MRFKEVLGTYDVTNVRVGHVVTNNISSELDSLTVILTNISKINIQSYDIVEFTDENDDVTYWLVGNIDKTFMTYTEPYLYEYVIDLISPTKLLEIPIPSHSITNVPYSNRGIKRFVEDAIKMYFKIDGLNGRYKNYISVEAVFYDYGKSTIVDNTTIQKFIDYNDGHAPECTFEKPTLREYLDYLFGFVGYISRVQIIPYNDYSYKAIVYPMNLNPEGNEINSDYIVEIKEQMQAENYITQIENNMDEVISPTPVTEYLKIKCEEPVMNEKNACLLTQYKMYDVKNFKVIINSDNRFRIDFKKRSIYDTTEIGRLKAFIGYNESQIPNFSSEFTLENGQIKIISDYYEIITISQDGRTKLVYKSYGATDAYYYNEATERWNPLDPLPDGITNHRLNNYFALLCRPLNPNPSYDIMVIPSIDLDLTNNLVLEEIYQTLTRVSNTEEGKTKSTVQNNALTWQRGQNKINNILKYETRTGLFGTQVNGKFAIALAVGAATTYYLRSFLNDKDLLEYSYTYSGIPYDRMYDELSDTPTVYFDNFDTYDDAMLWTFKLIYIPYTSFKIRCSKDGATHTITSMDSNTNASTNVMFEIKRTKEKIKQLANSTLILQGFSSGSIPTMKVGDYKVLDNEKYTLISLETKHDGTSNVYKGIMSKNYSNQVINTIINREKRYYSLPDPSSAVIRHEKVEMHITGQNNASGYSLRCNVARVMVKRSGGFNYYSLLPCTMIFSPDNRRITYTVDMVSNAIYGYKATDSTFTDDSNVGGKIIKTYKYTDDYGINDAIYFTFGYTEAAFADKYEVLSLSLPQIAELPTIALTSQGGFVKDSREHLIVSLDLIIDDDTILNTVKTYMSDPDRYRYDKFNIDDNTGGQIDEF